MTSLPKQALRFTVLLAVLLFTACQNNPELPTATVEVTPSGSTRTPVDGPIETPAVTAMPEVTATSPVQSGLAALQGQKIAFWHPWQGDLAKRAQEKAEAFNRSNEWGLTVEVSPFYNTSALTDQVDQALAEEGSGLPNVIAISTEELAGLARGSTPIIIDLSDYLNDPQVGLSETEVQAFGAAFWAQEAAGDLRFGLPALNEARVLFYNETWAKELGFSAPPATPDEFREQSCEAAIANNAAKSLELYGTGGWLVDNDPLTTLSWLTAFGANPIPTEEGQPYRFESDEGQAALSFLRDLMDDGCAWLGRSKDPQVYFAERKALFLAGTLEDMAAQARWYEQLQGTDEWTIIPFPSVANTPVVLSAGTSYGVMKSTPELELGGWLFARWLASDENTAYFAEALPALPVSETVARRLAENETEFPWNHILPLAEKAQPAPGLASWRLVRRTLEDAGWQVYHLPTDGVQQILPELDMTIAELLGQP